MQIINFLLFDMQIIDRITLFPECRHLKAAFLAIVWNIHTDIFSEIIPVEFENELYFIFEPT